MIADINLKIKIPENVSVEIDSGMIKVKGPLGENQRMFSHRKVEVKAENGNITITAKKPTKREKTVVGTLNAHIKNMLKGVTQGFVYKMKIASSHFPMSVTIEGEEFVVKNFLGEKIPRRCKLPEGVKIKIEGSMITLESADIEKAGQAASLIELITRITRRDRRVFQDGIFLLKEKK